MNTLANWIISYGIPLRGEEQNMRVLSIGRANEAANIIATQTPRELGVKQKAWIDQWLKPAARGARKVAKADANASRARRMAEER